MTSTRSSVFAALVLPFFVLTACGTSPAPATTSVCIGPESPDDLEDFLDRDLVRHPDAACRRGSADFAFVSVTEVPAVGEEIPDSPEVLGYRAGRSRVFSPATRSQSPATRSQSPAAAPGSAAPRTSAARPSAANTAPSAAPRVQRAPAPTRRRG